MSQNEVLTTSLNAKTLGKVERVYSDWEESVVGLVAESLDISHSDAAGVVESQQFYMQQSWGKGMDANQTAEKILSAS